MAKSLSRRDLETLSAYLDGQLSPRNMRKLESRLGRDPELHRTLEQLRQTRRALRSVPQARAPRSFTLTPEMAGQRIIIPRGYTLMRAVAVTASLMFAVVFVGELFLSSFGAPDIAFAPAAGKSVAESYAMQDMTDEDVAAAAEPAEALERAVEVEKETEVTKAPVEEPEILGAALPTITTEEKGEEGLDTVGVVGTPTLAGTPPPLTAAPMPEETTIPTDIPPPIPPPTATPAEEVPGDYWADDKANELPEGEVISEELVDVPDEKVRPGIQVPPIRLIEGGLVLIALLSGGMAYLLRRKMQ